MTNDRVRFAEFELDKKHRRLYREGETVQLYAKAFDLLEFLIGHNGSVVTKDEILSRVWPDQFVEEANLSVQISALRKALGEARNEPRFLVTVPGVGYKFVGKVEPKDDDVVIGKSIPINDQMDLTDDRTEAPTSVTPARSKTRWKWIAISAGILIAVLGVFAYKYFTADQQRIAAVAVIPFVNENNAGELEYLSEGLAESVIYSMSRSPDLRVLSRNSSFRYRGGEIDAKAIGSDLDVDAILTGRITGAGDSVSIRTELISTADNSVIWGEQFTRKLQDVERLQTDIARAIAAKLRFKLSDTSAGGPEKLSSDPETYKLYVLGRFHLSKVTDEGFFKGRDYFEQAIERDPNYALAYAGLAEAYNRLCGYNAMPSSECFPKSRIAAEKALELDDGLADAHATLASVKHFYDWDFSGAEKNFRRAIEIDPNNSQAHQLFSYHLTAMEQFDESMAEMRRARELDPLSIEKTIGIAEILYFQRRNDEALVAADKALELDSNAGFVHWIIGNIYLQKGMPNEAIAQYEKSIPLSGDSSDERASLAYTYARAGRKDDARRILQDLEQRSKRQFISPCILAIIHAGLDEKDESFEWLERAYSRRDFMLTLLKIEPTYDRLRDDPRYADLMSRVGFK